MSDLNDSTGQPQQGGKAMKMIARAGLFVGALAMLMGVGFTVFCAYLVWHGVDAAASTADAQAREDMMSYFRTMNHQAGFAVGTFVLGLIVLIASMAALSRKKG